VAMHRILERHLAAIRHAQADRGSGRSVVATQRDGSRWQPPARRSCSGDRRPAPRQPGSAARYGCPRRLCRRSPRHRNEPNASSATAGRQRQPPRGSMSSIRARHCHRPGAPAASCRTRPASSRRAAARWARGEAAPTGQVEHRVSANPC
jgi:hypothetical protein